MPHYVIKALHTFPHPSPKRSQYTHHQWTKAVYGQKVQYALTPSSLPVLDKKETKKIQSTNCTFLNYFRAVNPMILPTIPTIHTIF